MRAYYALFHTVAAVVFAAAAAAAAAVVAVVPATVVVAIATTTTAHRCCFRRWLVVALYADGLAGRLFSGSPWNTMIIMSMWTHQSSPPPTNLFLDKLGMVPVNSSQLFGCVGELFCVPQLCFNKNGNKKFDEDQILHALAMMRRFSTKGVTYQTDQKGLTETTVHSYG
jgi:hypothetical protein